MVLEGVPQLARQGHPGSGRRQQAQWSTVSLTHARPSQLGASSGRT
jgi:hypothetical protein